MVHCNINLENNERGVYYAGQVIKGTIEVHLEEPKKVNGIYFVVYGAAYCHWTEEVQETLGTGDNRRQHTRTDHYEGRDVYLDQRTYFQAHTELLSGTHRYEFECQLPPMIPASFEATHGHIRYHVEAVLDLPWRFDQEFKLQFHVMRNDDLNEYPELAMPCKMEEFKHFCCLFCRSDPLLMTVTVPCSGYVPGQTIKLNANFDNKSSIEVQRTKINLKRIIRFNSYTPMQKAIFEVSKMVEIFGEGVKSGHSLSYEKELTIPPILMNTNNRLCNVVQVTYDLKVEAEIGGCHRNIKCVVPIVIANIPFTQTGMAAVNASLPGQIDYKPAFGLPQDFQTHPGPAPYTQQYTGQDTFPVGPPMNEAYPTIPFAINPSALPPSFDEAVKDDFTNLNQPSAGAGWVMPSVPSKNVKSIFAKFAASNYLLE